MGRIRIGLITVLAMASLTIATTTAYGLTLTGSNTVPSATYTNWGYLTSSTGAASVAGWKWTATGWQAASFPTGASAWIYPWGSGWNWVYRSGAWYAFTTSSLATWTCTSLNDDPYVYSTQLSGTLTIKKYNASNAASAGTLGRYDRVTMQCGGGFGDAAGGATSFALVKVEKLGTCSVLTPECFQNPPVISSITGYVDASKISDLPTQPGQGTFGEIPED
jgi:hypothetical protein